MNTCPDCGAVAFMETETCDACGKPFKPPEAKPKPPPQKRRKMSFEEFEAGKRQLNRLKAEWFIARDMKPPPDNLKELEAEIETLTEKLEANLYLALLFEVEK